LGLAIGLLVLGSLLGGAALRFVFGDEFSAGAPVLRMLTVALSLGILLVPSARVLIVLGRQDIAARAQVVATAVSLIAMVVLVPHWGPSGAAAARVVAALVLLAICWVRARSLVAPSGLSPSE